MPGRTTYNPSGPRQPTTPRHPPGTRQNNTVRNHPRVQRDVAFENSTSSENATTTAGPTSTPLATTAQLATSAAALNATATATANATTGVSITSLAIPSQALPVGLVAGGAALLSVGLIAAAIGCGIRRHQRQSRASGETIELSLMPAAAAPTTPAAAAAPTTPAAPLDTMSVNPITTYRPRIMAALAQLNLDPSSRLRLLNDLSRQVKGDSNQDRLLWCLAVLIQEQNPRDVSSEGQKVLRCLNLLRHHLHLSGYIRGTGVGRNLPPNHSEDPYRELFLELKSYVAPEPEPAAAELQVLLVEAETSTFVTEEE